MKIEIDTDQKTLSIRGGSSDENMPLYSDRAFEILSDQWVKVGWNQNYSYTFSWYGRPIIQLPEDMIRMQEVIHAVRPTLIIETGVAHGGSLIYYASLMKAMDIPGRIIGVDIEVRPHNRKAIEEHPLASYISLVIGGSTEEGVINEVSSGIRPEDTVLVILDSDHSHAHVAAELEAYQGLVTRGSYLVATDGVMRDLNDVPKGKSSWKLDNPARAAEEFAARHPEFLLDQPAWPFNESGLNKNITHWPSAWLKRLD